MVWEVMRTRGEARIKALLASWYRIYMGLSVLLAVSGVRLLARDGNAYFELSQTKNKSLLWFGGRL